MDGPKEGSVPAMPSLSPRLSGRASIHSTLPPSFSSWPTAPTPKRISYSASPLGRVLCLSCGQWVRRRRGHGVKCPRFVCLYGCLMPQATLFTSCGQVNSAFVGSEDDPLTGAKPYPTCIHCGEEMP